MKRLLAILLLAIGLAPAQENPHFNPVLIARAQAASYTLTQDVLVQVYIMGVKYIEIPARISQTATVIDRCGEGACLITTGHGVRMDWAEGHGTGIPYHEFRAELDRFGMRLLDAQGADVLTGIRAQVEALDAQPQALIEIRLIGLDKFLLASSVNDRLQIPAFLYSVTFNEDNRWHAISPHMTGADIAIFWAPVVMVQPMRFCESHSGVTVADPVFTFGSPAGIARQYALGWVSSLRYQDYASGWEDLFAMRLSSIGGSSGSPVYTRDGCALGIIKGGVDDITLLVPYRTVNAFLQTINGSPEPEAPPPAYYGGGY